MKRMMDKMMDRLMNKMMKKGHQGHYSHAYAKRAKMATVAKMAKLFPLLFLSCVVFFLAVPLMVQATGLRPAKTSILSEEMLLEGTQEYVGRFWVVNNDAREFSVTVYVDGEMAQYVTLSSSQLHFRPDTDAIPIDFTVHLPESVPPGQSTANIVVEEDLAASGLSVIPGAGDSGGNGGGDNSGDNGGESSIISSKIVLKHKIVIEGQYPDKFIKTKLNFHEKGNQIEFVSEVENLGKEDLEKVQTTFYVNDKSEKNQVVETQETALKREENKLLSASVSRALFSSGEFDVAAVTSFDGQQVELMQKLIIGEPEVEITYFDKYFIANAINQYSMELMNHWNQKVENVFVDVAVERNGQAVDEFRTKSVDIEGEMSKRISDYLNAKDKGPGTYTFTMLVNYWNLARNSQREYQFESEFLTDEAGIEAAQKREALVGKAALADTAPASFEWKWVVFLVLGVIIGIGGWYLLWRYKHKDEYEGDGVI